MFWKVLGLKNGFSSVYSLQFGWFCRRIVHKKATPHGLNVRLPALAILLGKPVEQVPELAKLASPVYQVSANASPLFIVHGEQDI
jgi:hypothetical protein